MRSAESTVTVTTAGGPIVQQSTGRVAIIFPSVKNARYSVSTLSGQPLGQGIDVQSGIAPVILSAKDFGDSISRQWFGIADTTPVTINIIEVFL